MWTQSEFEYFVDVVFAPRAIDRVLVLTDRPAKPCCDNPDWIDRRMLAQDWRNRLVTLASSRGFRVLPLLTVDSDGAENGLLPSTGSSDGETKSVAQVLSEATLCLAMTEHSMTAALVTEAKARPTAAQFRAASMPLARRDMESSCLNIDYSALRARCSAIAAKLRNATRARVQFSTGHECTFDLRHRRCGVDDGYLHADKIGPALINLPSGEVWITPYEGERAGDPSQTNGIIAAPGPHGSIACLHVEQNTIVHVDGDRQAASHYSEIFDVDPARRNIGEISFGCNHAARLSGLFIEEEKAGFHWGFGRSDFLGGAFGPEKFKAADTILHHDIPCATGAPISVTSADIAAQNGDAFRLIDQGRYTI